MDAAEESVPKWQKHCQLRKHQQQHEDFQVWMADSITHTGYTPGYGFQLFFSQTCVLSLSSCDTLVSMLLAAILTSSL